ncbi:hypothetical protein CspeluHIS016_0211780 [Cutaneotrichosporon spelunceum]|uniref:Uncharacterized protein n=1 Tax=Cutaneotrichosporon spelunceum TaxID=1672016 RepID=A0AAD3YBP3_9TREE|nr:hypothetical protein CspeluHIS016_0211780 [Cutaneotrichosporon spelunceum]
MSLLRTARAMRPSSILSRRTLATASTVKVHVVRGTLEGDVPAEAAYTAEVPAGLSLSEVLSRVTPTSVSGGSWVAMAAGSAPAAVWSVEDGVRLLPRMADTPVTTETRVNWSSFSELPSAWIHARLAQDASLTPGQLEHEFVRIATQI